MKDCKKFQKELIFACKIRDIDEIKRILNEHEFDESDELGEALIFACSIGSTEIVNEIMNHIEDVAWQNRNGKNALTMAFKNGHRHLFNVLIDKGVNFNCHHGFKLLFENCKSEEMDDFEFLLMNGAPTNQCDQDKMTPLMIACENGCIEKVRLLLNQPSKGINRLNTDGFSPLYLACLNNHQEVARLLVEKGADLNNIFMNETALTRACKNNHLSVVELLVNFGANLFLENSQTTPYLSIAYAHKNIAMVKYFVTKLPNLINEDKKILIEVVRQNDLELLQYLIERSVDLNAQESEDGLTPLMVAIEEGNSEIANVLIQNGANLDAQNDYGDTALTLAVEQSHQLKKIVPLIKLLIEKNADINLQNNEGKTALVIAIDKKAYEIVRILVENGANIGLGDKKGNNALMLLAEHKNDTIIPIFKLMITKNPDFNLKTYYGLTALMLAIDCENHEIARLLIAHGADVNLRDNTGDSALMFATSRKEAKKSIQIIEMIIKKKADLNLQNNEGNTALMIAIQNQNFQMARILIQNEANVNMVDKNGKNALLYVIQSEETSLSLDVLKMLIKKKADLNLQNNEGNTALMIAIENQNFQMAHILILNGANVNMVDKTALLYVVRYKETCHSIRLLKMMIQKDVDVNLQNKGKTALMIAIENGNDVTANLLLQNGANVDLITERQETAIHYFCSIGKIQSVHFLIKHNANLNIQNSLGKTPLMIALENKNFMISEMLIDYNADLDIFDRNEESFWFYFCAFNSNEFLKNQSSEAILWYFKEYKPKSGKCLIGPNEQRNENLRRYFVDFHKKCLSKLEERNTWFDKPNHEGQTPLLRAIQRKADKWIIELLIRKGANISHVSKRGETALSYAIENNLVDIAELLIKSGANLNLGLGLEPYLYTVCMKRIDSNLCKLLIEHGANLHCRHSRSGTGRVFASLCDWLLSYDSTNRNIYRNALIKELSDTFKYTDYKRFQERVIKSIEDEDVIIVDRNHLEALGIYNKQEKELVEVIEHLKSLEFRERLIADYLNVLEEQKEILETKVLKLDTSLQKSKEPPEKRKKKCQDDFLCDEEVESELDCIESSGLFDEQTKQLEIARRYVQTVKTKLKDGQKLLEFVEKKLLLDQQVY